MATNDEQARRALIAALDRIDARERARKPPVEPWPNDEAIRIPGAGDLSLPVKSMAARGFPDRLGIGGIALNAAGVRELRDACDRWLATQDSEAFGDNSVKTAGEG